MESSNDKTIRKMIHNLSNYEWTYQYSIFVDVLYVELEEAKLIATDWLNKFNDSLFRDYLRKKNKDVAMMFIIRKTLHRRHSSNKKFHQYYITIFSTDLIDGIENVGNYGNHIYNVVNRKVTALKIQTTCNALQSQNLHDISSLNIHRYSLINKSKLIPKAIISVKDQ